MKKKHGWYRLFFALALIAAFIFIAPFIASLPIIDESIKSGDKYGIKSGPLFYTETEQFLEMQAVRSNSQKFGPAQSGKFNKQ